MEETTVLKEIKNRICVLTLNRPEKLNSMNDAMTDEFKGMINEIKDDSEPKAVVITGAGRAFSAGGNLERMSRRVGANPAVQKKTALAFYKSFLSVLDLEVPVIAAINGHAIGAGACLPLACDMRLAVDDCKIGFTFAKIGLHPGMGAEYFLTRIIGEARTYELLMTGDIITADEAYRIGLINHVTAPGELMDRAMGLAEKIVSMPVLPIRMLKESIPAAAKCGLDDALSREAAYQAICFMSDDIREGIDATREKRKAEFRDE